MSTMMRRKVIAGAAFLVGGAGVVESAFVPSINWGPSECPSGVFLMRQQFYADSWNLYSTPVVEDDDHMPGWTSARYNCTLWVDKASQEFVVEKNAFTEDQFSFSVDDDGAFLCLDHPNNCPALRVLDESNPCFGEHLQKSNQSWEPDNDPTAKFAVRMTSMNIDSGSMELYCDDGQNTPITSYDCGDVGYHASKVFLRDESTIDLTVCPEIHVMSSFLPPPCSGVYGHRGDAIRYGKDSNWDHYVKFEGQLRGFSCFLPPDVAATVPEWDYMGVFGEPYGLIFYPRYNEADTKKKSLLNNGMCSDDLGYCPMGVIVEGDGQCSGTYQMAADNLRRFERADGAYWLQTWSTPSGSLAFRCFSSGDTFVDVVTSVQCLKAQTTTTSTVVTEHSGFSAKCTAGNFHLYASYLQEATQSFCPAGNPSCPGGSGEPGSDERFSKIVEGMPKLFDSASQALPGVDVSFWSFQDKPVAGFGQVGVDTCGYQYFSLKPWESSAKSSLTEAFADPYFFGSGKDYLESQLDTIIRAVRFGEYPNSSSNNLNVVILVTHKAFHSAGDYSEAPSYSPSECTTKYACCDNHDYPSVDQFYNALMEANVYPIVFVSDSTQSVVDSYTELIAGLERYSGGKLTGAVRMVEGASSESLGSIMSAFDEICEHRSSSS